MKNSDLVPIYKEIADEIGVDNTIKIFNQFKGQQITFPQRLYTVDYVLAYIQEHRGKMTVRDIARKFGYSERRIRQLMKEKTDEKNLAIALVTSITLSSTLQPLIANASAINGAELVANLPDDATYYIFADSESRYLDYDDVYGLDDNTLQMAINEIYAKHGRMFTTPEIQDYFDGKRWYTAEIAPEDFSEDLLNGFEKGNIEFLAECMSYNETDNTYSESESDYYEDDEEYDLAASYCEEAGCTSILELSEVVPTWSPEYLAMYIEHNDMDMKKIIKQWKKIEDKSLRYEEYVPVKLNLEAFKTDYYSQTKDGDNLFYAGEMKNGMPDGAGFLVETIPIYSGFDYAYDVVRLKYMGYFEDGYYSGWGIEYSCPDLEDVQNNIFVYIENSEDGQMVCEKYFNPIEYIGEFKKGERKGEGAEFSYPDISNFLEALDYGTPVSELPDLAGDIMIIQGDYKNGEIHGDCVIYGKGKIVYEGELKNYLMDGYGKLYYLGTDTLKYEGEFKDGLYDGEGTEYSEDGDEIYSGEWENGDYAY